MQNEIQTFGARGEPMAPSKGSHESAFAFDLHELNENNIHYL